MTNRQLNLLILAIAVIIIAALSAPRYSGDSFGECGEDRWDICEDAYEGWQTCHQEYLGCIDTAAYFYAECILTSPQVDWWICGQTHDQMTSNCPQCGPQPPSPIECYLSYCPLDPPE